MNYIPRSAWTALVPRPATMAETYIGMPFFTDRPVEIDFEPVGKNLLYINRSPHMELNLLLKEAVQGTGFPDLNYNYAIAGNVPGVFVIRGAGTKCRDSRGLRVLMLIGENERPTDLLKENQKLVGQLSNKPPGGTLRPGDSSVHVFDLIEYLIEAGYYKSRNDGVYNSFCEQAVRQLQLDVGSPNFDGIYDTTTEFKLRKQRVA